MQALSEVILKFSGSLDVSQVFMSKYKRLVSVQSTSLLS